MQPIVIHADRAFTPFDEIPDALVVIQGSKISAVGQRGKVDLPRGVREITILAAMRAIPQKTSKPQTTMRSLFRLYSSCYRDVLKEHTRADRLVFETPHSTR